MAEVQPAWQKNREDRKFRNLYSHLRQGHDLPARFLRRSGKDMLCLRLIHNIDHAIHAHDHQHKPGNT